MDFFKNPLFQDVVSFHSPRFAPVLPEGSQVDMQTYGAELAFFLCGELMRHGVVTSYPLPEDGGWYLEYRLAGSASPDFALHCSNIGQAQDHWMLSLHRVRRRIFSIDARPYSDAAPLLSALFDWVHTDRSLSQVHWLYQGELSMPGSGNSQILEALLHH